MSVAPGEVIDLSDVHPEKEGYVFTSWYLDEDFTEPFSQFETASGQTTLYARFVPADETVTVHFDTMGGEELADPGVCERRNSADKICGVQICTSKEGYTFSGWCLDEECEQAFAYTGPD